MMKRPVCLGLLMAAPTLVWPVTGAAQASPPLSASPVPIAQPVTKPISASRLADLVQRRHEADAAAATAPPSASSASASASTVPPTEPVAQPVTKPVTRPFTQPISPSRLADLVQRRHEADAAAAATAATAPPAASSPVAASSASAPPASVTSALAAPPVEPVAQPTPKPMARSFAQPLPASQFADLAQSRHEAAAATVPPVAASAASAAFAPGVSAAPVVTPPPAEQAAQPTPKPATPSFAQSAFAGEIAAEPLSACPKDLPVEPLTLVDAISRALCNAPATHRAFATRLAQAAQVRLAQAAYLPTVNVTGGVQRQQTKQTTDYEGVGYTQSAQGNARYGSVDLNWVLFDFGQRRAALDNAKQLMLSAFAAYDDAVQTAFVDAAQAYYDADTALADLDAARLAEASDLRILEAAAAKRKAGAGELADELQAQTAHSKAMLTRIASEGRLKTAMGRLAIMMGAPADTPIVLAGQNDPQTDADYLKAVGELIDQAQQRHPKLRAARANLDAARAQVNQVRDQGLPTISLGGSLSLNNPANQSMANTSMRDRTVGIQISIPLFEGGGRSARVAAANAQADAAASDLADAERKVATDVWSNYQSLVSATGNFNQARRLLSIASESLRVAQGRYQAGVGNIIDLLNAQSSEADARQARINALVSWRMARLKLAESLGQLGFWSIQ